MLRRLFSVLRRDFSINTYTSRTHNCGELTKMHEGQHVSIMGWVLHKRMNRFLVLRDAYGHVQATLPKNSSFLSLLEDINYESVIRVDGIVRDRGKDKNEKMSTGDIEIEVSNLLILNHTPPHLPLSPDSSASEKTRLRYRYIDIRSARMQRALRLRSEIVHKIRRFLIEDHGFIDVETPTLFRRTPGGAAEFLVPAAPPNQGKCYSLPQSPQQFKQLLMIGAIDRYFQIARCYRDEGSKGDRQPEFTQVDLELSFTNQDAVMQLVEDMIISAWPDSLSSVKPIYPFPRMKYSDAMRLYGTDKPDMRIPWVIEDCTDQLGQLRPSLHRSDWVARLIVCRGQGKHITESRKKEWQRVIQINDLGRSFTIHKINTNKKQWFKFIGNDYIIQNHNINEEDAVVFCWGDSEGVQWTLGQLRNFIAEASDLRKQPKIMAHWVVDFPLFSMKNGKLVSTHHPFTAPIDTHKNRLQNDQKKQELIGQHYDLVINGVEIGGGSIRIHSASEQINVLETLGENVGEMAHLLEALSLGAPPHGGFALGLDRFAALLVGNGDSSVPVREVIAFPKSKDGRDLMSGAPVVPVVEELNRYRMLFQRNAELEENID